MFEQSTVSLKITFRPCHQEDLPKLEWFGMFTDYRETSLEAFERQENGEVVMLVAEVNHFPIGQLWIDLTKQYENSIGVLWVFRVLPPFQGIGIGSCLLATAERILKGKDFTTAEIGVEKDNLSAKRLYERLGYQVVGDNVEEWDYTTPSGEVKHSIIDEWIMHKKLV
jgi:ribosomal protein S18 acetylase RimI-like enzyme